MIKAILFNLDDTLLLKTNPDFTTRYAQLVESYFQQNYNLSDITAYLHNPHPALKDAATLTEPCSQHMISAISQHTGYSTDEIAAAFQHFHTHTADTLSALTQPAPDAQALLDDLQSLGIQIAFISHPWESEAFIRQRLAWAGLRANINFIASSDNVHFCRPDPTFYAEIIARLGVEPDEALMVGADPAYDIHPACTIGLCTYHIGVQPSGANNTLQTLRQQIKEGGWLDRFSLPRFRQEAIEPQLRGNIGALFGLLSTVAPDQWNQRPDPQEWSVMQIVCHLRESEIQVQRPRLERILIEDNPFITVPPPPGHDTPPCATNGMDAARDFMRYRLQTIHWLQTLPASAWQRPARHSIFSMTTFLEMAQFTAQHDRLHISQICQTLGKCAL